MLGYFCPFCDTELETGYQTIGLRDNGEPIEEAFCYCPECDYELDVGDFVPDKIEDETDEKTDNVSAV